MMLFNHLYSAVRSNPDKRTGIWDSITIDIHHKNESIYTVTINSEHATGVSSPILQYGHELGCKNPVPCLQPLLGPPTFHSAHQGLILLLQGVTCS